MRILIDNQYKTLYGGEFKEYVETNIIKRLSVQKNNIIDYPNNFEDTQKLLNLNNYDLVVVTGYDSKILGAINDKKYNTKVACIIYDMNAEQILPDINDNGVLSNIISFKSRLIFLSNYVLTYDNVVRDQILELYNNYKSVVNVESKLVDIDFLYELKKPKQRLERIIKQKYILIPESINGLTFLSAGFDHLIDNIISNKNRIPRNFIFVIICEKFPDKIFYKIKNNDLSNSFKIFNDVDSETLNILYKQAIASLFISPIDNNLTNLCDAIFNNCLCMINYKNKIMTNFVENSSILMSFDDDNMFNDILEAIRLNSDIKKEILETQKINILDKISKANNRLNINI